MYNCTYMIFASAICHCIQLISHLSKNINMFVDLLSALLMGIPEISTP
jgi:hypothetical protein